MAKITLPEITAGYNSATQLNNAFALLAAELQGKVLYRDNPAGEPNTLENEIDMNTNDISNVGNIDTDTITVAGVDLTTKVGEAATSAANAATSETNAASSAAAALASELAAAGYLDNFDDKYLGAKSSAPTLDNDGNALTDGALYFDTVLNRMYVYDLGTTAWLATSLTTAEATDANTVATNIADVSAVAAIDSDVSLVAAVDSDVTIVAGISTDVSTVSGISTDVTTVSGISADVTSVAADATDIGTVATSISNVNTVGSNIGNVNIVAGINTDITAVAADEADIGIVGGISSDVTTVSGIASNVTTVAGISGNVTTVASNSANVTSVASNAANITTVAGNSSNINTVASNNANVTAVGSNITNVNTVAANISPVNLFGEQYLGVQSSAPTTTTTGALYYDSVTEQLYIWDGAAWQAAAFSASGAVTSFNTRTGAVTLTSTDVTNALTYTPADVTDLGSIASQDANNVTITGGSVVGMPSPTVSNAVATKGYVDSAVAGLKWKTAVQLHADSNISLTGTTGTLVIDGHAALVTADAGYRLLLTGQSTDSEKGIYVYNDDGANYTLTRSTDGDVYTELEGASVFVQEGTLYEATGWTENNYDLTDFTGQTWVQFAGAGTYAAGTGLTLTGNVFAVDVNVLLSGAIGTNVQAWDAGLDDIAALTPTDSNFIVGDGANWVAETGATARTSLGLGALATLNTVGAAQIDTNAVTSAKIAANSVGADELNVTGNGTAGQYLGSDGDGTMTWTTISADPTVGGDLSGTASNAQIVAGAVGTTELATNAVTTDKITDANITDAKIAGMSSSKLTGPLPAIDGSALTGLSGGGTLKSQAYTTSGTWTNPGSVTSVKVTVIGGGGGGACMGNNPGPSGASGPGGAGIAMVTIPTSPVAITVGAGGQGGAVPAPSPGKAGGTSSFGAFVTATGGTGQTGGPAISAAGQAGSFTAPQGRILSGTNTDIIGGALSTIANPGNGGPQTASTFSTTMARTSSGPTGEFWNPNATAAGSQGGKSIYAVNLNRGRGGMSGIVIVEWVE